ncbi:hypothetical protein V6N12_044275 [Hibiscus sabdariffa]|uniref:Uncharacterized protein n=1 Tax=Hibiscus sabdariffa TaxID=183260 RepID=A0ABR2DGT4_9ROSI
MVDLTEISQLSVGSTESMAAGGVGLSVEEPTSDTALVNSLVAQGVFRVSDKCTTRVQQYAVFPSVKQSDVAVRQSTCVLPSTSQATAHTCSSPSSMDDHSDNPRYGGQTAEAETTATYSENIVVDNYCGLGSARCQSTDVGQTTAFLGSGECGYSGLPDSVGILSPQLEESSASEVPIEHSIAPSNTHSMQIIIVVLVLLDAKVLMWVRQQLFLVRVSVAILVSLILWGYLVQNWRILAHQKFLLSIL